MIDRWDDRDVAERGNSDRHAKAGCREGYDQFHIDAERRASATRALRGFSWMRWLALLHCVVESPAFADDHSRRRPTMALPVCIGMLPIASFIPLHSRLGSPYNRSILRC